MSSKPNDAITADGSPTSAGNVADVDAASRLKQLEAREQSLAAREQALKERERKVKDQIEALKERETEVETAKMKVQRDLADLAKRQQQVAERESALEARARDVAQREIEASEGFASKNRESLGALTRAHASLRAEVERLQTELDAARLKGVQDLEKRLADERRTRTEALDAEIEADRKRHLAKLAAESAAQDAALAEQRARFAKEQQTAREEIERERVRLADQEAELRRGLGELRWKEEDLAGYRASIERSIEERARDRVASLERQLDALREDRRRDRDLVISLESQLAASRDLLARFGDDPAEIEKRIAQQAKKISDLENELLRRPSASDKELLVTLQEQERVWSAERDRLVREITQLKAEQSRWLTGVADLEQQRERREAAERRLDVLRGEMEKYAAEVDRMRSLYEKPQELEARVGEIETPLWEDIKRAPVDDELTELAWLDRIAVACGESGFRFPKRLVYQFHTALKTAELSPFTVLAGVSGTGKSALPRLYAHFGGLAFQDVAVQPNWDSPQSLFGFFNSIDNRYNATELLRAMVQSQKAREDKSYKHGFSDRLLLVLLDEMNLAHVEHYFSEQISRLGKPLAAGQSVVVPIDLGAGMRPYQLQLGRNILWVGTMNEDETTKTLSDKVIDRSNLLFFPRPRTLFSRADVSLGAAQPLLPLETWESWTKTRSPFAPEDVAIYRRALESMNRHLEHVGRALGHRVWQSVEYYLANHPEVIAALGRNDRDALTRAMRQAFEDQIVLKVMPKLRGIETTGDAQRKCLDPIRKQLDDQDLGLRLAEDFEIACRVGYGAFVWNSARYLEADE